MTGTNELPFLQKDVMQLYERKAVLRPQTAAESGSAPAPAGTLSVRAARPRSAGNRAEMHADSLPGLAQLEAHLAEGTLTRLRLAFSRKQAAKVYVQHLLREDGAELWALLQRGGHVYICGGTLMGRDVVEALSAAVARHGALGAEGAAKYLKEMEAAGRLVKELWS